MNLIGQGRTADIYEHPENKTWVIKLCKEHVPEDDVRREFQIASDAFSLRVPTPEPIELVQLDGRMGIVYERADGVPLLKVIGKQPLAIKRHAGKLAALHHAMHVHQAGGEWPRQKEVLRQHIEAAAGLADSEKEAILHHLERLPDEDRLCHGDFHPDNVMSGKRDWIIDWNNGMRGNPAGDVARTVLLIGIGSMPPGIPRYVELLVNKGRNVLKDLYLKAYLQRSGMTHAEMEEWLLPMAAARLVEWIPDREKEQLLAFIRERMGKRQRA